MENTLNSEKSLKIWKWKSSTNFGPKPKSIEIMPYIDFNDKKTISCHCPFYDIPTLAGQSLLETKYKKILPSSTSYFSQAWY